MTSEVGVTGSSLSSLKAVQDGAVDAAPETVLRLPRLTDENLFTLWVCAGLTLGVALDATVAWLVWRAWRS